MIESGLWSFADHENHIYEWFEAIFSKVKKAITNIFSGTFYKKPKTTYSTWLDKMKRDFVIWTIQAWESVSCRIHSLTEELDLLKFEECQFKPIDSQSRIERRIKEVTLQRDELLKHFTLLNGEMSKYSSYIDENNLYEDPEVIGITKYEPRFLWKNYDHIRPMEPKHAIIEMVPLEKASEDIPVVESLWFVNSKTNFLIYGALDGYSAPNSPEMFHQMDKLCNHETEEIEENTDPSLFKIGEREFSIGQKIFYKNQKWKTWLYKILWKSEDRDTGLILESYDGHRKFAISGKRLDDVTSMTNPSKNCPATESYDEGRLYL
ncbi:MAG: hypothetical protein ACD_3C00154G0020 [uncultured bacterium (gcode 4)]|uniref:Uncharacterized protein n=1 Tax=uncultured bacterium (gcode 4) TaxID=1234023 RepID=K2G0T1_9BACT|nr:MAG: hypothetical protein ACD_3C00154G0020 [uncultured bacterium (gcode 4)]